MAHYRRDQALEYARKFWNVPAHDQCIAIGHDPWFRKVPDGTQLLADLSFRTQDWSRAGELYDMLDARAETSEVLPRDTQLHTTLADGLQLNIPIISSDMDTVTESRLAIAMALNGGLGLIHYNMPDRQQLSEVSRVKNNVHGLIQDPIKATPDQLIGDILELIENKRFAFSTFPVVDGDGKLAGLLP